MSTLRKFKAYFGMVPLEDFEDDYLDEPASAHRSTHSAYDRYDARYPDVAGYAEGRYDEDPPRRAVRAEEPRRAALPEPPAYREPARRAGYDETDYDDYEPVPRRQVAMGSALRSEEPYELPRRNARPSSPPVPTPVATRGALAVDLAEERRPVEREIIKVRPRDYSEARIIGESYRDGSPVIMDLVEMSNADAKRLVDFAAGLAFALRGSFDKVATKVFLLAPQDTEVAEHARKQVAEHGYYSS